MKSKEAQGYDWALSVRNKGVDTRAGDGLPSGQGCTVLFRGITKSGHSNEGLTPFFYYVTAQAKV